MQIPSHQPASPAGAPASAPAPRTSPGARPGSSPGAAPGMPLGSAPLGAPAPPASAAHLLQSLAGVLGMPPDQIAGRWEQSGSLAAVAAESGLAREDLLQSVVDVVRQGSTRESLSSREQLRLTLMATDIIDGPVRRSVSYSV